MRLRSIEIDFDIHKMIEAERRGFDEPPYLALRRLLKLPVAESGNGHEQADVGAGVPFVEDGVSIPHGSLARMEYQRGKQVYEGQFLNGRLVVDGRSFKALSGAASALAVTRKGKKTKINGWNYWKAKFPNESEWRALSALRLEAELAAG